MNSASTRYNRRRSSRSSASITVEHLEPRAMLAAVGIASSKGAIKELAAAGKSELAYISEIKREVKVVESDLARFAREVMKANDRELSLSKKVGDWASYEVNVQDKGEIESIRREIRDEVLSINQQLTGIGKDIKGIVSEGTQEMRRNPAEAENRLVADIIDLESARVRADGVIEYAVLRRDQVESKLELVRARAGAEGVLGVYTGNPTGGTLYPLGLGDYYDGHTSSGEMTMFLRLEGNRIIGQQVPKASDRWSVARYNQYSQYGGQSAAVLVDATIDCQLDGNANITFGTLMMDLRTNRGRAGGPVYYELRNGSLSPDLRGFNAEVWNSDYNQIVGYLTLQRT